MNNEPPEHLKVQTYHKGGINVQTNIIGMYRLCADSDCKTWIGCPFVKCQKHRNDFAKKDSVVPEWRNHNERV